MDSSNQENELRDHFKSGDKLKAIKEFPWKAKIGNVDLVKGVSDAGPRLNAALRGKKLRTHWSTTPPFGRRLNRANLE